MELRKDPDLRAAMARMAHAAAAFLSAQQTGNVHDVKEPACEAIAMMRDRGWPPEQALRTCKRICSIPPATLDRPFGNNQRARLADSVVSWLVDCYFTDG